MDREKWGTGVLNYAQTNMKRGQTLFDVGAHVGEYSLLFSEIVGTGERVIAFEPDPIARENLEKNIETNRLTNVSVEELCLGNREGRVLLTSTNFGNAGSSILAPDQQRGGHKSVEVASTTVDAYCESRKVIPNWIKIDVEGAESLVVQGMSHMIQTWHPSVILEFHGYMMEDVGRLTNWLKSPGSLKVSFTFLETLQGTSTSRRCLTKKYRSAIICSSASNSSIRSRPCHLWNNEDPIS